MDLQAKVFVVTGGGSGIGRQLVLNLLDRGAIVAAVDIDMEGLGATRDLCGPWANRLSLHRADVSDCDDVCRLARDVLARHRCVDGIINNAGIIHPFKPVLELDERIAERVFAVNYLGVVNVTRTFLPWLLERPSAHIANVSSLGGLFAFPNQTLYGASKAAVKVFSEGLYAELRHTAVGVTVVFPGAIATNITHNCAAHTARIDRLHRYYKGTSAERAARRIIAGIEANRARVTIGADAAILDGLYRLFPRLTVLLVGALMRAALPPD